MESSGGRGVLPGERNFGRERMASEAEVNRTILYFRRVGVEEDGELNGRINRRRGLTRDQAYLKLDERMKDHNHNKHCMMTKDVSL